MTLRSLSHILVFAIALIALNVAAAPPTQQAESNFVPKTGGESGVWQPNASGMPWLAEPSEGKDVNSSLQSEMPNFESIREGLSSPNVNCFLQDRRGFVWVGTTNGVTRMDGYFSHHFAKMAVGEGRLSHSVKMLYEDTISNCIWATMESSNLIARIDLASFETTVLEFWLPKEVKRQFSDIVFSVVAMDDTTLLCRTPFAFCTMDKRTGHMEPVCSVEERIVSCSMGFLPFRGKLYSVSGGKCFTVTMPKPDDASAKPVVDVLEFKKGSALASFSLKTAKVLNDTSLLFVNYRVPGGSQFWAYNPETKSQSFLFESDARAFDCEVADDGIWVTTNSGLRFFRFADERLFTYNVGNSLLLDNNLSTILKLRKQPIFLIGTEDGAIKLNYYASKFYLTDMRRYATFGNGQVWSAAKDEQGTHWVGSLDGLFRRKHQELHFEHVFLPRETKERENFIISIAELSDGSGVAASSNRGVYILDLNGRLLRSFRLGDGSSGRIRKIQSLPGDRLIVTRSKDFVMLDTRTWALRVFPAPEPRGAKGGDAPSILHSHSQDGKRLWFVNRDCEVWCMDLATGLHSFDSQISPSAGVIRSIRHNAKGGVDELWLATSAHGLIYKVVGRKEYRSILSETSPNYSPKCIELDKEGNLWATTEGGLMRIENGKIQEFSHDKYHICRRFNNGNGGLGHNGEIIFGGKSDFVEFGSGSFGSNRYFPKPELASYRFSNSISQSFDERIVKEYVYGGGPIVIPAGIRTVELFVRVMNFDRPTDNVYEWSLDDSDEWTRCMARSSVVVTNLSEGKHKIYFRSVDYDGTPQSEVLQINVTKDVFFFSSRAFLTFSWVAGSFLLVFSAYWWLRRNKRIQKKLANDVKIVSGMLLAANVELRAKQEVITKQNKELADMNSELEAKVEQRTKELEEAKSKAEESSQLKSTFLASLGHEVRTPMNAIVGFAKLLETEECSNEERTEFAHLILESCNNLLYIIGSLLDSSRIERGLLTVSNSEFEVYSEINDIWRILSVEKKHRNVQFLLDIDPELQGKVICSDKDRLRQVIFNIVYNAFKFTRDGHVKIIARYVQPWSLGSCNLPSDVLPSDTPRGALFVMVEDTGVGIPVDKLKVVFEPFRRLTEGKRALHGGLGLGLNIVRGLVEKMGGHVWADSVLGKGATFSFYLPF